MTVIATAGSFSAVSALFGGPLVAGVLLLEAGLAMGAQLIPALMPGLVAAAVGYLLFVGLGDWGGLDTAGLAVPDLPAYDGTRLGDLALAVVAGVVIAVVLNRVRRLGVEVKQVTDRHDMLPMLLLGGLAVGFIALAATWFDASDDEILFSGQSAVPEVVAEGSVGVLVVILVAKSLGYAISLGCGFRGGPIFPAIFIGITIASFAVVIFDASPTWAIAVGTAAGMAAGTEMVFSALLFSMLLVGQPGLDALPAAVLAVAAVWLTKLVLASKDAEPDGEAATEPQPG
jgi:H+/Cl- antiporter ClcA